MKDSPPTPFHNDHPSGASQAGNGRREGTSTALVTAAILRK